MHVVCSQSLKQIDLSVVQMSNFRSKTLCWMPAPTIQQNHSLLQICKSAAQKYVVSEEFNIDTIKIIGQEVLPGH